MKEFLTGSYTSCALRDPDLFPVRPNDPNEAVSFAKRPAGADQRDGDNERR
jgi:hypothetical protein